MPAQPVAPAGLALIFNPVGPAHNESKRGCRGIHLGVAGQGDQAHGCAGPVDPALGEGINIDRARGCAPIDPAVGQIKPRIVDFQEGKIIAQLGHHHCRCHAAGATRQPGGKAHISARVALPGTQNFVVARDQAQFRPGHRFGTGQRAHKDVHSISPVQRRQSEVGNNEPLGRLGFPFSGLAAADAGDHDVDARFGRF